jgi:hypothetical protein
MAYRAPRAKKEKRARKPEDGKVVGGIPAPKALQNPVDLADWLELSALSNKDRNASKADLQRLLTRAGGDDPAEEGGSVDGICLSVFVELESRQRAAPEAYPFEVATPVLRARPNAQSEFPAYVFCLCLSAWRWIKSKERPDAARRLFEDLSCFVARNFLGGEAFRFASPRDPRFKSFSAAVDQVCKLVGEGNCFRSDQDPEHKKDDTLDVVAWRHFPDRREGKLVLFGQCASGGNWLGKRPELQPRAFAGLWLERIFAVDCLRAFFVPHRVGDDAWEETTRKAGLTFDRCRVAYWAHQGGSFPGQEKLLAWADRIIRT